MEEGECLCVRVLDGEKVTSWLLEQVFCQPKFSFFTNEWFLVHREKDVGYKYKLENCVLEKI